MPPRSESALPNMPATASTKPATPPRAANRKVYNTLELRQHILSYVDLPSLAVFMRVETGCMADVARELYRTMALDLFIRMKGQTHRHKIYFAAVNTVDARNNMPYWLTKTVSRTLHSLIAPIRNELFAYQPHYCNVLVEALRKRCPNLRTMKFGRGRCGFGDTMRFGFRIDEYEYCFAWTAQFDPSDPQRAASNPITFYRNVHYYTSSSPPKSVQCPPPPTSRYVARIRFDLKLTLVDTPRTDDWLASLRDSPLWADLHTHISLDGTPVTLEDLASLYRRQISAGHSARLEDIFAPCARPWTAYDFEDFARIASTSLRSLNLYDEWAKGGQDTPRIAFRDLPFLTEMVLQHLPNLATLSIAVTGIDTAEAVFGELLHPDILARAGSLRDLRIYSEKPPHPIPFYNTLRYLMGMTARDGGVLVLHPHARVTDFPSPQRAYVDYLQGRPPLQQKSLATIDFATIGITTLAQVLDLEYHPDGRPRYIWTSKPIKWSKLIKLAQHHPKAKRERPLRFHLADCLVICRWLEALATKAALPEILAKVKELAELVGQYPQVKRWGYTLLFDDEFRKDLKESQGILEGQVRGGAAV